MFLSRAQLLGITDSKTPPEVPSQNGTLATKSAILGFPCACWNPYFCSVWWLNGHQQKDHFPKTDSFNENAGFFSFRTQIVCAYLKNAISAKEHPPKKHNFSVFVYFYKFFVFHVFHIFSFSFFSIERQKQEVHTCFWKPLFWHPDKLPKKYFHTPTHYLCFF